MKYELDSANSCLSLTLCWMTKLGPHMHTVIDF
jgi:hypothetical protein